MARTELSVLIGLHRTASAIDRQTARLCANHGLTLGQFAVLEALYHKGDMTVGQVQEKVLSSSGTIPVVVGNLEKRGYLERCADDKDARRRILHITDAGRGLIAEVFPENEKLIVEAMSCWTDEEKRQLSALLRKFGGRNDG